jgi:hypothetical protein
VSFEIFKGGRLPPLDDATHPRLWASDFMHPAAWPETAGRSRDGGPMVTATLTADWQGTIPVQGWGMDLNDQLGDCGCAGMDHRQMGAKAGAGQPWTSWGNTVSLQLYETLGGYVPGNPSTDNGTVLQANLGYWKNTAIQGDQIIAYGALRPGTWDRGMRVLALRTFGPLYIGINCPNSAETQFPGPWTVVPGSPIAGGHCVVQVAEFAAMDEIRLVSWGAAVPANMAFFMTYTEEVWVIIDADSLERIGQNPYGVDLAGMNAKLGQLTGVPDPLSLGRAAAVHQTVIDTGGTAMSEQPQNEQAAPEPVPAGEPQEAPLPPSDPRAPVAGDEAPLPANAVAAAARAHALLGHFVSVAQAAQADLEKYVPATLLNAAKQDALTFIREVL